MLVTKSRRPSASASVWRLLLTAFAAVPAVVTASVDGDLGEARIGYGDKSGDLNTDASMMPQVPGATLPGATQAGSVDTSDCDAVGDACCSDTSVNFQPYCSASLACDQSTKTCTTCDQAGDPCCFDPDASTDACDNLAKLTCELTSDLAFTCKSCDAVGSPCCSNPDTGASFCYNSANSAWLTCDDSQNTCADPQNVPIPCGTTVYGNGIGQESIVVWDMGDAQTGESFHLHFDLGADDQIVFFYIFKDRGFDYVGTIVGPSEEDPDEYNSILNTRSFQMPASGSDVQVGTSIFSTGTPSWTVKITCPK